MVERGNPPRHAYRVTIQVSRTYYAENETDARFYAAIAVNLLMREGNDPQAGIVSVRWLGEVKE